MYKEACKILGVKEGANIEEIKKAYRQQAKLIHPDLNPTTEAHHKFIILNTAFEYLVQYNDLIEYSHSVLKDKTNNIKPGEFYKQHYKQSFKKKKIERNFLTYPLGKIIYIFFHLLFFSIGIFLMVRPTIALIRTGVKEVDNPGASLLTLLFSIIFGAFILWIILDSSFKVFRR